MKTKLLMRGPFLTSSGYGEHSRMLARWALLRDDVFDTKFVVTPWGDTPWLLNEASMCGLIGEIMHRTCSPGSFNADVSVQVQLPNEWDPKLAATNIGVTAAVETDRCNPSWIGCCNNMDVIVVPSQHVKQTLKNTGDVTKPVLVVPECYNRKIPTEEGLELNEITTSYNFLLFGQLTGNNPYNDRKNTFNTIKWICEAFKNDPDVGIILKTNVGRNTLIDRSIVKNMMRKLLSEVRRGPFPKLYILHGNMSEDDVAALYKSEKVKALVALTRGEGFGLPILEAAASGVPVIATEWSGHVDFLGLGKYIPVSYSLVDVHHSRIDGNIFVNGSKWAEPSEVDAKKKLTKLKNNDVLPRQWAAELSEKIVTEYSFPAISNKLNDALLPLMVK